MQSLTKETILHALTLLDEKLGRQDIKGEICLIGGSVMVLAFNARKSTKDVDAIFQPAAAIRAAIKEIQYEQDFPNNWMNDAAKVFTSPKHTAGIEEAKNLPHFSHLTVFWPRPDYLLAMKAIASRVDVVGENQRDVEDIKLLVKHLGLKSPTEVFDIVQKYYAANLIPPRTQYVVKMVFQKFTSSKSSSE